MKTICCVCRLIITDGQGPVSYGYCEGCQNDVEMAQIAQEQASRALPTPAGPARRDVELALLEVGKFLGEVVLAGAVVLGIGALFSALGR